MLDVAVVVVFPALWVLWTVLNDPFLLEWTSRRCAMLTEGHRAG